MSVHLSNCVCVCAHVYALVLLCVCRLLFSLFSVITGTVTSEQSKEEAN